MGQAAIMASNVAMTAASEAVGEPPLGTSTEGGSEEHAALDAARAGGGSAFLLPVEHRSGVLWGTSVNIHPAASGPN